MAGCPNASHLPVSPSGGVFSLKVWILSGDVPMTTMNLTCMLQERDLLASKESTI